MVTKPSFADPHLLDTDPDLAFHFEADPDPTFPLRWIRFHIKVMQNIRQGCGSRSGFTWIRLGLSRWIVSGSRSALR